MSLAPLMPLIEQIEAELSSFYGFAIASSAKDHLLDPSEPKLNNRGRVLFSVDQEEMFIGVEFNQDIVKSLTNKNPLEKLNDENLDAYCVVIEEISHFHLLINRAQARREVSHLELEWQGEVDKLLLSATRLHAQNLDPHYLALARRLYDQAKIISPDPRYSEATKYAAKFWYDIISYVDGIGNPMKSMSLKAILQPTYDLPWSEKTRKFSLPKAA